MSLKSKSTQFISYNLLKQPFPFAKQKRKAMNLDKDAKGQTVPTVTDLLHRYNCIVIHVPNIHTNLFQPLDVSVNKKAKCFLAVKCQDWYSTEVWKQLTRCVEPHYVNVDATSLTNIKPLDAN